MSDLISRQAAIDAVEKESQVDEAYGYMDTKSIIDLLCDLPSAQPEIIRCKDCKHQKVYCYEARGKKYFSYNCELAENNSHVCLDNDFCSRGERREK